MDFATPTRSFWPIVSAIFSSSKSDLVYHNLALMQTYSQKNMHLRLELHTPDVDQSALSTTIVATCVRLASLSIDRTRSDLDPHHLWVNQFQLKIHKIPLLRFQGRQDGTDSHFPSHLRHNQPHQRRQSLCAQLPSRYLTIQHCEVQEQRG
jgi:hypothetical protein